MAFSVGRVIARGYEGYVAKDEMSLYEAADAAMVESGAKGLDRRRGSLATAH
jgi:hypothetical protein